MDVDENEDGTQHVRRVPDFGIEVDFEGLEDDEREVRLQFYVTWMSASSASDVRMVRLRKLPSLKPLLRN